MQLTSGCAGFVNTFAAPIALKNVSSTSKYGREIEACAHLPPRLDTGFMFSSWYGIFSNSS